MFDHIFCYSNSRMDTRSFRDILGENSALTDKSPDFKVKLFSFGQYPEKGSTKNKKRQIEFKMRVCVSM